MKKDEIILEIRAGIGGEEAALFAKDLFRMYLRYGKKKGWKIKILSVKPTSLGGFKEIIFSLKGKGVFENLKYEGGIHRIQRIPKTEKSGRIHTSTATVAVLKKPSFSQIKIDPSKLKFQFFRASGPGGQYVNKRATAVRVIHLPTGISASSQTSRSQFENRKNALAILEAKLFEIEKKKELKKLSEERKRQVRLGQRSEKIRTYNFLSDRITDHRIKKTFKGAKEILDGKLDRIIKDLKKKLG